MNATEIEERINVFTNAVRKVRESFGAVGGESEESFGEIPDVRQYRQDVMNALTSAAATNSLVFSDENGEEVSVNRILRIEHQTWVRAETDNGNERCFNLMNFRNVDVE